MLSFKTELPNSLFYVQWAPQPWSSLSLLFALSNWNTLGEEYIMGTKGCKQHANMYVVYKSETLVFVRCWVYCACNISSLHCIYLSSPRVLLAAWRQDNRQGCYHSACWSIYLGLIRVLCCGCLTVAMRNPRAQWPCVLSAQEWQ